MERQGNERHGDGSVVLPPCVVVQQFGDGAVFVIKLLKRNEKYGIIWMR